MTEDQKKNKEKDHITGVETTGHEWDGLKELNNPAPRWWLWVFLVTVIWSVGYWVIYPAWPTSEGNTKGKWGWTQHEQLKEKQTEIAERRSVYQERFDAASLQEIKNDPALFEFARVGGASAFKENCAACHGTGAAGAKGYPNLNDDDWIWCGTLSKIYETIKVGINSGHVNQHSTIMPAFGKDGILNKGQIQDVVEYVFKLHQGNKAEITEAYNRGQVVFAENCASCHGVSGEGNSDMGAPRLNDEIWLWGGDKASIQNTVVNAHVGVMPAWEERLSPSTVKALAIYVYSLGGGQAEETMPAAPQQQLEPAVE